MRNRGLEMLLFRKILRTYLMDDPLCYSAFNAGFNHIKHEMLAIW